MPIVLRDYQHKAIEDVRAAFRCKQRSVLLVAPTGSGKTVIFSYIAQRATALGNKVLILAHRQELLDQIGETLNAFQVQYGFVAAVYPECASAPVQIASVQTLARRSLGFNPELIICDEAHHCTRKNTYGRILSRYPRARILGVTATPLRLSGEGLGEIYSALVNGPTVQQLIDIGALSAVRIFAPPAPQLGNLHVRAGEFITAEVQTAMDKPKITGDAVDHYRKHANNLPAVVYTASIEHAVHVTQEFNHAGYKALSIDGKMDRSARREAVRLFRARDITHLISCDLISEGFDCPGIHVGISLRPTASLGLWLQQVGRCLRPYPGKPHAIILDHAGNTLRHGLPTEDRDWSLAGREKSRRAATAVDAPSVRVCPRCFSAQRSGLAACKACGHVFAIASRKVDAIDGELEEVRVVNPERREQGMAQSLEKLTELGRIRGYASPERWAKYVFEGRQQKRRA